MSIFTRIKKAIPEFREQSQIVKDSYGGNRAFYCLDMLWCLIRYGARPIDYTRFEFHRKSCKERNRYLTIMRYFKMIPLFRKNYNVGNSKSDEYKAFSDFVHRDWVQIDINTPNEIIDSFLKKHKCVILKPNRGEQGKGVRKLDSTDFNNTLELINSLRKEREYVLEEALSNHPVINLINPSSLNTIRAYTLTDFNKKTTILGIMLRVGVDGNDVDNWGSGGIRYSFDIETGICDCHGRDKLNNPYIFHPHSDVQMIGFKLPQFEELKSYIFRLTQFCPDAHFVGWDIAITPDGYELVEVNCPGGHDFLQAFGKPFGDVMRYKLN